MQNIGERRQMDLLYLFLHWDDSSLAPLQFKNRQSKDFTSIFYKKLPLAYISNDDVQITDCSYYAVASDKNHSQHTTKQIQNLSLHFRSHKMYFTSILHKQIHLLA
jgi:hypothetical protein